MPNNPELVTNFRDIVDKVISASVKRIEKGPSRPVFLPGYTKEARAVGLTFTSVGPTDARLGVFGHEKGHLWGVSTGQMRYIGHTGTLGIVSRESEPNNLRRIWNFDAFTLPVVTSRQLEDHEAELAIRWMTTPHLETDAIDVLASLTEKERLSTDEQFAEKAIRSQQYQRDVEAMERARRLPPEAWFTPIG